jgi:hypothetical protein
MFIFIGLLHGTKNNNNFSPSSHPNAFMGANDTFISNLSGSTPKINNNSFGHNDSVLFQHSTHLGSISPDLR